MRRVLAVLLVGVALGCLGLTWLLPSTGGPDGPDGPGEPAAAPAARALPARAVAPSPPAAPPVVAKQLRIPAIDVGTRLVQLGLHEDGTVEVPTDPDRAGWFDLGPVPGHTGSSVVLGHVDSTSGPAVFARLSELTRGDQVEVRRSDGGVALFRVRTMRTYANDAFPAEKVYGDHGRSQLVLVTCGGDYDSDRGGYQANVVVYAELVKPA